LVRMFHMFSDVCCKRFDLAISCMLQVFYLDVAYVSLQVYVTNVSSALDVCCIQVFHVYLNNVGIGPLKNRHIVAPPRFKTSNKLKQGLSIVEAVLNRARHLGLDWIL
jgi:hypothetical protein